MLSLEWSELFGLRIALSTLKASVDTQLPIRKTENVVADWMQLRIKQLEDKGER